MCTEGIDCDPFVFGEVSFDRHDFTLHNHVYRNLLERHAQKVHESNARASQFTLNVEAEVREKDVGNDQQDYEGSNGQSQCPSGSIGERNKVGHDEQLT